MNASECHVTTPTRIPGIGVTEARSTIADEPVNILSSDKDPSCDINRRRQRDVLPVPVCWHDKGKGESGRPLSLSILAFTRRQYYHSAILSSLKLLGKDVS